MAPDGERPDRGGPPAAAVDIAGPVLPPAVAWLGLLHPDGPAGPDRAAPSGPVAVGLFAPTVADLRRPGWLARALDGLERDIGPDGLAYVVVPRTWRARVARVARRHGLHAGPWFLHLPSFASTRQLIPIEARTLRYALDALIPGRAGVRKLLHPAVATGASVLRFLLPSVGFVARKPGARPLLEWLLRTRRPEEPAGPTDRRGTAVVAPSWRGPGGSVVLHRFRGEEPWPDLVAKVAPGGGGVALASEAANLVRFGPDARRAGAIVPDRLALTTMGTRTVLLQSAVRGQPAAVQLAAGPAELPGLALQLTGWLGRWHALTRSDGIASPLPRHVLDALDRLAPHVTGSAAYRGWLAARCASLSSASIPLVAAHNDLTMWNVLLGEEGALGVVDWEHATAGSLPLVDFFYAIADAVMTAGRHTDRLAAVAECIGPAGPRASLVARLWSRLAADLALPDGLATLAFHACWLHHGANALAEPRDRSGARAFVDIVRWLARHHVEVRPGAST